jgi:Rps23 Pro-64 3,4-dihydroxylase Tpa1-like proline 4-hydroxylase
MALASSLPRASRSDFLDMRSLLPLQKMEEKVEAWAIEYQANRPYPHIGIDNFFDETVIQDLTLDYPAPSHASWQRASFDPQHEEAKLSLDRLEEFPSSIRNFVETLNSPIFLRFLERLVGIDGLIPDPYLTGGGLHMTPRGGRLGIHADFNFHKKLRLDRRLNLLLYLNHNWSPEWGGEFELWDKDVKTKVKSYLPIANRLVVFSTTDISFHGHPDPINCPKGQYRRSIALYYYSNGRPTEEQSETHSTVFKARPDDIKPLSAVRGVLRQLTPPLVWEIGRRLR